METEREFIDQVVEDYGWSFTEAELVAALYYAIMPGRSWQERWELFCEIEDLVK